MLCELFIGHETVTEFIGNVHLKVKLSIGMLVVYESQNATCKCTEKLTSNFI